jgi:hypothetical protein
VSVGRYTLSRSAVARLMGPAYERERAGERARAREREREREFIRNTGWNHILVQYSIPAPVLCHVVVLFFASRYGSGKGYGALSLGSGS